MVVRDLAEVEAHPGVREPTHVVVVDASMLCGLVEQLESGPRGGGKRGGERREEEEEGRMGGKGEREGEDKKRSQREYRETIKRQSERLGGN